MAECGFSAARFLPGWLPVAVLVQCCAEAEKAVRHR